MNKPSQRLPAGFEALEPFIDFWAVDTSAERSHCRDISDEASRRQFYDAAIGLIPQALDYLDTKPLNEFDESEQRLMKLALSFAHVSMAVELQKEVEPEHAAWRPFMQITRSTADL